MAAIIIASFTSLTFYCWIRFFCPESEGRLNFKTFARDRFFPFNSFPVRSTFIMGLGCLVGGTARAIVATVHSTTMDSTSIMFIFIGTGMALAALLAPTSK